MCIGESSAGFAPYFLASGVIFLIITVLLFSPAVKKWKPRYLLTSRIISIALALILFFYAWAVSYLIQRGCV